MAEPFFLKYPIFSQTSRTGASFPRLQARYEALIKNHRDSIHKAQILDLGSHDGRWAFAAIKAGATHVVGVEPRSIFVKQALTTFREHHVPKARYNFAETTAQKYLADCREESFDTIFCFGLLYHLPCFEEVLTLCSKVTRRTLLLDTVVYPSSKKMIWKGQESTQHLSNGVSEAKMSSLASYHQIRIPSLPLLTERLGDLGFTTSFYPWHSRRLGNWHDLDDYFLRQRVTILAEVR